MYVAPVNLKILAYTLDIEGFDGSRVLRHCGYDSLDSVPETGDWVSIDVFDRMMAAALEVTGDPCFGLVAGKSLALMKYGAIASVVLTTPTFRQMLDDVQRYARLSVERSEVELVEDAQGPRLVIQPVVHGRLSGHFRTELVMTSAAQMLRFGGADMSDFLQVDFVYDEPREHMHRYLSTFGPSMRFGARSCSIRFNPALLERSLPSHDPVGYMVARTRADALLAAVHAGTDLAERVRKDVLGAFPDVPTVADTASRLGMTERSLRRQLGLLDASHADLVQECQRGMAERWLAEGVKPLKQIAEDLGFASVHGFHRAFRRWTGKTPNEWRGVSGATDDRD